MSYEITLNTFQGPLDLLLHLIEKNKVDIYDIPIAEITSQYMDYIQKFNAINLDIASEFLVMAATLLEIKSKMLLPEDKEEKEQLLLEEMDPRQELVEKLIEYKKYKQLSQYFKEKEKIEGKVIYKDPEYFPEWSNIEPQLHIEVDLLFKAFKKILVKRDMINNNNSLHEIQRDTFSVEEKIQDITNRFAYSDTIKFSSLFDECQSRNELITVFLAILELIKMRVAIVKQEKLFDDFFIIKDKNQ